MNGKGKGVILNYRIGLLSFVFLEELNDFFLLTLIFLCIPSSYSVSPWLAGFLKSGGLFYALYILFALGSDILLHIGVVHFTTWVAGFSISCECTYARVTSLLAQKKEKNKISSTL
jgi:hypothetical protein